MNMSKDEYGKYVQSHAPRSGSARTIPQAFLVGGLICVLGQGAANAFSALGLSAEDAGTAASIALIFLGVLLTGLGVYDDLAKLAGAGTLVPITGFANSVAAPALEFKTEGFILGTAVKMFSIAGPVIVYGVSTGMVYGLILLIFTMV